MGLQSALSTALTGLNAAETTIDVVGNNVANSQTVGFKESGVNFATQFLQTISIGAAPSDTSGGTNPRQVGLGVKVAEITPDFTQGTIEISSNPLDVAIQGDGFLLVQGSQGEQFYTRNGQLKTNQDNEVVTVTGQRVLGYSAQNGDIIEALTPLTIPIGGSAVNQVTQNVAFSGTLSPTATVGVGGIIESNVLGDLSVEAPNAPFTITDFAVTPDIDMGSFAGAGSGSGALPAGTYSYRVSFTDDDGNETAGSNAVSVVSTGGSIDLTGLDAADGTNYTKRNIYRTAQGGTGGYFLVGQTVDESTTTFTDTTLDSALVTPLNEDAIDNGAYSYYVTFFNSTSGVETRPTAQIGTVSVSQANQRIRIENIPQPTGSGFDEIRIYRNLSDDSSTHYRVGTIDVNTDPTPSIYIDAASDSDISGNPQIDLDGPKINQGTLLLNVQLRDGSDYLPLFEEGTLSFTGKKGDINLAPKELEITTTTTVQEWMDFINESLGIDSSVPDAPATEVIGGQIRIGSNAGLENYAQISQSSFTLTPTSTGLTKSLSIPFSEVREPEGVGTSTDFVVYDSLGIPLSVRVTTTVESKDGNNTIYRWFATSSDSEPESGVDTVVGSGLLTFDNFGNLVTNNGNASVAVDRNDTASSSPLVFELDFSNVSGLEDTNNLGESVSTLNFTSQDGFPPGVLTNFAVTESGEIRGVYSNGIEQTLGQIRMARFTNASGLQQLGDNLFAEGVNSGEPQFGNPGQNGLGALTAGAVELSNTDIGQNLIELILASTQYRGGARVITAVQQLLDELLALRR